MSQIKATTRSLLLILCLVISALVSSTPANAASIYDSIVKTTASVQLQTSTAYCSNSVATEHNIDWSSVVSTALSTHNAQHNNAIADWESDWNNKVGWAVFSVTGANNQKFFMVYYSASSGENVFFSSLGNDYFTIYDPAPVTPFRSLIIMTTGDSNGNCNDQPMIGSASTGGLSVTADNFNTDYKLFLSTFTTFYPSGYEGVLIPSVYTPPTPVPYSGSVDCGDSSLQPISMLIYQDNNNGAATLTNTSYGVAQWEYDLYLDSPYTFAVECVGIFGGGVANPQGNVIPSETSGDWMCTLAGQGPNYCILS